MVSDWMANINLSLYIMIFFLDASIKKSFKQPYVILFQTKVY